VCDAAPPGENLADLAQSLTAISYLAGFAFVLAAIYKFKQHKDNPTLGLISAVWASLDDTTAASLTASGYSPYYLVGAVEQAEDGDTSDLLAFFNDLELLSC
jgi:hypothetical protein